MRKLFHIMAVLISCTFVFADDSINTKDLDSKTESSSVLNLEKTLLPSLPLQYDYTENGVNIICTEKLKNATLHFRQYNEASDANAVGKLELDKKLYCPYGSTVCFWLEYKDGIKSRAEIFYALKKNFTAQSSEKLLQVFNPKEGNWKNEQILNIGSADNTIVYYSLDGSDPEKFGQIYFKPFKIEKSGMITLRVKAISSEGKTQEEKITYTVTKRGYENDPDFYFFNSMPKKADTIHEKKMPYRILAWNYLEFFFQVPVYYEVSKQNINEDNLQKLYKKYSAPIFLDRSEDLYVFWSCESFKKGKIQKIFLPAKPKMSLSENSKTTQKPVSINFSDSRYTYAFTCGDLFIPESPSFASHKFDGAKKIFSLPDGKELNYNLRVKAFYEGIAQGEFFYEFLIDNARPPKLEPLLSTQNKTSNEAVIMQLPAIPNNADYTAVVKISPEAKMLDENTYLLDGEYDSSTDYHIIAYYEDKAKNRGEIFQHVVSVTPFKIYVDGSKKNGDGSAQNPFSNLENAFQFIKQKKEKANLQKLWTIHLKNTSTIHEPIFVSDKIKLIGEEAKLVLKTNVGFILENTNASFENILFTREEHPNEPRSVPIIYASNCTLNLVDVDFETKNDNCTIILFNTKSFLHNINFKSKQEKYTESFFFANSEVIMQDIKFKLKCQTAVAILFDNTTAQLNSCDFIIEPATVGRILELKRSNISLNGFTATRLPDTYNTDICIISDENSKVQNITELQVKGFKYEQR